MIVKKSGSTGRAVLPEHEQQIALSDYRITRSSPPGE